MVVQDIGFQATMKVLPLPYNDVILGIDWLELYSPMTIDWLNKWMVVDINGFNLHCPNFLWLKYY
jgi:hypothetical protein